MESEKKRKAGRPREFSVRERIQVSLEASTLAILREEAERRGVSVSTVAREAIEESLSLRP